MGKRAALPERLLDINGLPNMAEIDALPQAIKRAAYPIAGTYNCRAVADTGEPSPHGYGIAIDLNLAFSDYWYWHPHGGAIVYRNRMPEEIVAIFAIQRRQRDAGAGADVDAMSVDFIVGGDRLHEPSCKRVGLQRLARASL